MSEDINKIIEQGNTRIDLPEDDTSTHKDQDTPQEEIATNEVNSTDAMDDTNVDDSPRLDGKEKEEPSYEEAPQMVNTPSNIQLNKETLHELLTDEAFVNFFQQRIKEYITHDLIAHHEALEQAKRSALETVTTVNDGYKAITELNQCIQSTIYEEVPKQLTHRITRSVTESLDTTLESMDTVTKDTFNLLDERYKAVVENAFKQYNDMMLNVKKNYDNAFNMYKKPFSMVGTIYTLCFLMIVLQAIVLFKVFF